VGTVSDYDGNLTRALDPLYGGEMALNYNSRNWVIGGTVKERGAIGKRCWSVWVTPLP